MSVISELERGTPAARASRRPAAINLPALPAGPVVPAIVAARGEAAAWRTSNSSPSRTAAFRCVTRRENEAVLDRMAARLAAWPDMLRQRRESVEHPFGTIKQWMNQGSFLMRRLDNVRGEFSLTALALRDLDPSRLSFLKSARGRGEESVEAGFDNRIALARRRLEAGAVPDLH